MFEAGSLAADGRDDGLGAPLAKRPLRQVLRTVHDGLHVCRSRANVHHDHHHICISAQKRKGYIGVFGPNRVDDSPCETFGPSYGAQHENGRLIDRSLPHLDDPLRQWGEPSAALLGLFDRVIYRGELREVNFLRVSRLAHGRKVQQFVQQIRDYV